MAKSTTIELAYEYLKDVKDNASFEDIWNAISKDIHGDNDNKNEIIAELYSDLVLDNRFALTAEGRWGLRDFLKFDDVKKQYDYIDKFETTEEFEDIDSYLDNNGFDETIEISSKMKKSLDVEFDSSEIEDTEDDDDDSGEMISKEDSYDD